jgi:hypothetical protein
MPFTPNNQGYGLLLATSPVWVPCGLILVGVITVARKLGVYHPKPWSREITRGPGWDPTYGVMPDLTPRRHRHG